MKKFISKLLVCILTLTSLQAKAGSESENFLAFASTSAPIIALTVVANAPAVVALNASAGVIVVAITLDIALHGKRSALLEWPGTSDSVVINTAEFSSALFSSGSEKDNPKNPIKEDYAAELRAKIELSRTDAREYLLTGDASEVFQETAAEIIQLTQIVTGQTVNSIDVAQAIVVF